MTSTDTLLKRWDAVMMRCYSTPPLALASGEGALVTDVDGNTYIDFLGGIAVNVLGHCHPAVIEAATGQLATLGHTSNFYAHEPGIALAEALVDRWGVEGARVFFCNSGAEANELAFKLSRLTGRTNSCRPMGLSRPHDGVTGSDRPPCNLGAVRPAAGRCHPCALRRRRRAGGRRNRRHRGRVPRTDHGRGRRRGATGRLSGCRQGHHRCAWRAVGDR